ncbi:toxin-antitoxin system, antitoxin component domain protein [Heyndrickxia coagulans]|uniref:Toxin-antitoxin system, antitoxin component domain protein n=1 Tax=Heyndrickxia coagulans TaxID=1398 RepID=A0A133KW48_HEYCO|nr:toxin-antitoxin system, antitoxin component domain protein [Heyndrickxia coagulans]
MEDEAVFNKISIIERCLKRVREVYSGSPASLEDFTKQDSIILNIQRACEASIDLACILLQKNSSGFHRRAERLLIC